LCSCVVISLTNKRFGAQRSQLSKGYAKRSCTRTGGLICGLDLVKRCLCVLKCTTEVQSQVLAIKPYPACKCESKKYATNPCQKWVSQKNIKVDFVVFKPLSPAATVINAVLWEYRVHKRRIVYHQYE
jgi:hypothetical protein